MPEGHSVHRIARQFSANFIGTTPEITSPQGRFTSQAEMISGTEIVASEAVGKQLFLGFANELWLRVHLGIYGAWDFSGQVVIHPTIMVHGIENQDKDAEDSVTSIGAPRKARIRIAETEKLAQASTEWPPPEIGQIRARIINSKVCADLRGPTVCEVIDGAQKQRVLDRLGPDPANDNSQSAKQKFIARAAAKKTPIGLVLMDQAIIAGIGNVYRAEMLFRAQINPHTPANTLRKHQLEALWDDWFQLLDTGIRVGQMLTIDGLSGEAYQNALTDRDSRHWVYRKNGTPCQRCGADIVLEEFGARKLYWCPGCQL